MQSGKEFVRGLFVACCDTSIVLDGIEESLDEIALEGAKSQARLTLRVDFGGMTALMARSRDFIAAYNAVLIKAKNRSHPAMDRVNVSF